MLDTVAAKLLADLFHAVTKRISPPAFAKTKLLQCSRVFAAFLVWRLDVQAKVAHDSFECYLLA